MKNATDVQEFERVEQQLHSMLAEISELSKKRANDAVNKFKLKLINVLLARMNKILGEQRPFKDFESFDESEVPTNSDVMVMLSQYAAAIFQIRSENTSAGDFDEWYWKVAGKSSSIKTRNLNSFKFGGK